MMIKKKKRNGSYLKFTTVSSPIDQNLFRNATTDNTAENLKSKNKQMYKNIASTKNQSYNIFWIGENLRSTNSSNLLGANRVKWKLTNTNLEHLIQNKQHINIIRPPKPDISRNKEMIPT